MNEQQILQRVVMDPNIMFGKPIIRGTRLTVQHIISLLAHGSTHEEILGEYAGLKEEDIRACLLFAQRSLDDISFVPLMAGA